MKQDIFFALNSAKIQDDQKSKIDMLVEYLQNNPAAKVKVTGYADVNTAILKSTSRCLKNAQAMLRML